jgi:hypothetical protein
MWISAQNIVATVLHWSAVGQNNQEVSYHLMYPNLYCRIQDSPPLCLTLSQFNPVHTLLPGDESRDKPSPRSETQTPHDPTLK